VNFVPKFTAVICCSEAVRPLLYTFGRTKFLHFRTFCRDSVGVGIAKPSNCSEAYLNTVGESAEMFTNLLVSSRVFVKGHAQIERGRPEKLLLRRPYGTKAPHKGSLLFLLSEVADEKPNRDSEEKFSFGYLRSSEEDPEPESQLAEIRDFLPPTLREYVDFTNSEAKRNLDLTEKNLDMKAILKPKSRPPDTRQFDISLYSIAELAEDYHVPPEWLIEVLVDIGLDLPIRLSDTLTDLGASDDDIQELINRLHGVSREDVLDWYTDETLEEYATEYGVDLDEMLAAAAEVGILLSMGPLTRIRREQRTQLFKRLGIFT